MNSRSPAPRVGPPRASSGRALLVPHARVLRRGADSVQIGLVTSGGITLSGLTAGEMRFLRRLDEGAVTQAPAPVDSPGTGAGTTAPVHRHAEVLAALRGHGLLTAPRRRAGREPPRPAALDADAWARAWAYDRPGQAEQAHDVVAARHARRVVVDGTGRLVSELGRVLREGGVGRVDEGHSGLSAADLDCRQAGSPRPDVVVLVGAGAVPGVAGEAWRRRGIPHLPVVVDGPHLHVGPIVTGLSPCLRCLDQHRADRDPGWPLVLAQLTDELDRGGPDVDAESSLRALAAGLTAGFVHAVLDDRPPSLGHAISVSLPLPTLTHLRWRPHPRCRCRSAQVTMDA